MRFIEMSLPAREAGLLTGMLVGETGGMEREFFLFLKNSGLLHLVVVSGSNMMLLSRVLIENLAGWVGRKGAILIGLMCMWGYAGLAGFGVPVLRASLLVFFFYMAQFWGRKYDWKRALTLVVAIMMVIDWRMVEGASFWLSIVAFLAIVVRDEGRESGGSFIEGLWDAFITTIWVSLWVTPILALVFGKVSIVTVAANVMVVGVVQIISLVGGLGVLIGLLWPVLGRGILWLCLPLLSYFLMVVETWGRYEGLSVRFNVLMMAGWYLLLVYVLMRRDPPTLKLRRAR